MLKVDRSQLDCLRVQTWGDNLRASGFDHMDGVLAVTIHAGESSYTLTGTRDDMLAIAEVAAGVAGATIYDPKDDADSELK